MKNLNKTLSHQITLMTILFFTTAGCQHLVIIESNITPNAMSAVRYDHTAAIQFEPDLVSYIAHTKPSTYVGSAHSYDFNLGSALKESLIRSVEAAYSNVIVEENMITPGQYGTIIKFGLQGVDVNIKFETGFWSARAEARCQVAVRIESFSGEDVAFMKRMVVTGNGFSSEAAGSAYKAEQHFAQAIKKAIQQLSDNVANQMLSGFAEK